MAFREAQPFLIAAGVAALIGFWLWYPLGILALVAFGYILYFFRDPERVIPSDPDAIVSPADGRIVAVDESIERFYSKEKMKRVAVFLSVFDVHVNRSPVAGTVEHSEHHAGEFLDARHLEVDLRNESWNWLIRTDRGPVVVRQLAGLIARRIVAWKKTGESLAKGERFGLIRFGSRTDVYLPVGCEILVKVGDRVEGGSTILARWPR
jgi:phosphatidylserine decarboxylase